MTRTEFLDKLKEALKGSLSDREVQENVEYYAQYIAEETRQGKSEEEILTMLGDPWILARTIIDASDGTDRETVYGSGQDTAYTQYRTDRRYDQQKNGGYEKEKRRVHILGLNTWWKKLLLLLCVVLVIAVIVSFVTGIIRLLAPVLIPIIVVLLLVRIVKNKHE